MNDGEAQLLEVSARLLGDALETLRMITPEGWELARGVAIREGWHTGDTALMADARLLAMRGGPRFRPERGA